MPSSSVSRTSDVSTYPALFKRVKAALIDGQKRIEQEKVLTYWEVGRLIQTHILKNNARADYGEKVIERLAKDLEVSYDLLHRCVKFVKAYPDRKILVARPEFSWTHYKKFITVTDDKARLRLEVLAEKRKWSSDELAARIKASRPESPVEDAQTIVTSQKIAEVKPLVPLKGQLYTYQIQKRKVSGAGTSELVVDLGFAILHNVEPRLLSAFSAGDIVASLPKEDAYRFAKSDRTAKDLYTYQALIEKVIDGDTLKVHIDLGFDMWVKQTLRLRGIDCPELKTKAGDEAKAFVQSLLKEADEIVIRSSRSDKYDRYLADVFITSPTPGSAFGEISPEQRSGGVGEVYLNGLLLDKGYAKRYE